MKQYTLFAIFIFLTLFSTAQINKNSTLLGGQIGYSDDKIDYTNGQKSSKNGSGNVTISAGKAFAENKVVGLNISYGHSSSTNYYNGGYFYNTKGDNFGVGIFYRQYKKLAKDFYFFTEAGASYFNTKQVYDTASVVLSTDKRTGGRLGLAPGVAYKLCKKFYVELSIPDIAYVQYTNIKTTATGNNNSNENQFNFSSTLSNQSFLYNMAIGFRFVF